MRIAVVGSGLTGLTAARRLAVEHEVVVVDKNTVPGGRLATRRIGEAVFDSGAQFFTVRGDAFAEQVDDWVARDVARIWCHGFHHPEDGYPRFAGSQGMACLADDLASDLDVRLDHMVFSLRHRDEAWDVVIDDGTTLTVDRVLLTCPVAQAWSLLAESDVALPDDLARREYHRTIALLVALDRPSSVPDPGGVQADPADPANAFGFIGDSVAKGISREPAVTFHATQPWSTEHWDDAPALLESALLERAEPWLGEAGVVAAQVVRWRFAGPVRPWPAACWSDETGTIVVAGDLFAGPKVEGAFNSGLAAAAAINRP